MLVLSLLAAVIVVPEARPVQAVGGYINTTSCLDTSLPFWTGTTKIICYDIGGRKVYTEQWSGSTATWSSYSTRQILDLYFEQPIPTMGYWQSDSSCTAYLVTYGPNAFMETRFTVGTQYGLGGKVVRINQIVQSPSLADVWREASISSAGSDMVAWLANSNTGYACVIVP